MSEKSSVHIYRVMVKGKFAELTDRAHQYLVDSAEDHTYFKSAFTPEGTFVYDADLNFFSLRYEVRAHADQPDESASATALKEAETFLQTMGFGYSNLRIFSIDDMSTVWQT